MRRNAEQVPSGCPSLTVTCWASPRPWQPGTHRPLFERGSAQPMNEGQNNLFTCSRATTLLHLLPDPPSHSHLLTHDACTHAQIIHPFSKSSRNGLLLSPRLVIVGSWIASLFASPLTAIWHQNYHCSAPSDHVARHRPVECAQTKRGQHFPQHQPVAIPWPLEVRPC